MFPLLGSYFYEERLIKHMELSRKFRSGTALFLVSALLCTVIWLFLSFATPYQYPSFVPLLASFLISLIGFVKPEIVPIRMSKVVIILAALYLVPGTLLGAFYLHSESSVFVCDAPAEPHGYITMSTGSFENPDKSRCHRRVTESWVWTSAIASLWLWPLMLLNALAG